MVYVQFPRLFTLAVLSLTVAMALSACGGGTSGDDDSPSDEIIPSGATPVDVTLGDSFFLPDHLTFPADKMIAIRLKNNGTFVHNMRIAGLDGGYETDDDLVSTPTVIKPGKGALLVVSLERGLYHFRCDFHPTVQFGTIAAQ